MICRFLTLAFRLKPNLNVHNLSLSTSSVPAENLVNLKIHNQSFETSPSSLIPLQKLIDRYKKARLRFRIPTSSPAPSEEPFCDSFSYSEKYECLVRQCEGSSNPEDAERLHSQIIKNGLVGNLFLYNTLINLYVRTSNVASAHRLFAEMPEKNAVTWTCLISGYTHQHMPDEACALLRSMICAGYLPTHYTFGSVLRACQDSGPGKLRFGMQVHALISKTPYMLDVVVSNAMISMYGSCCLESVVYARRVFYEIQIKNSISWNSIISVYSQRGYAFSAFELFAEMQLEDSRFSSKPNEYTFGSLITAAHSTSSDCSLCLLDQMFARAVKSGFSSDLYVGSALVSGFSRVGLLDEARKIFGKMSERNVVSMNGLMVGLVRQKRGEAATQVFIETKDLVGINCDSYVVLLSACAEFKVSKEGKKKGREVHAFVLRTGLNDVKVAIENGLVNMYAKCAAIDDACKVFNFMSVKDMVSWNSMISGLDQNGRFKEAVTNFQGMKRSGFVPSNFTLISALSSCASLGNIVLGAQIHCEGIKSGLDLDVSVSNSLLAFYSEANHLTDCRKVFSLMTEYDQVSWNSIIGALADTEAYVPHVIEHFLDMMRAGWSPNRVTFLNVLAAITTLSIRELGRQVHSLVLKHCIADDSTIENALLFCYGKCGEMDDCEKIFSKMSDRRDEVSWNSMISGYIRNGLLTKAMDLVWFMIQKGQRLDGFTFATVLSACASVAALERGMEIHARWIRACLESDVVVESALVDMYSKCGRIDYASRVFGVMPMKNEFSWNSMISGYARHGHGVEALELFDRMLQEGKPPDHVTFVGVLSACSHVGLVNKGFEHFESMSKKYGLTPRMEHFSCMVDLLSRAGELSMVKDFIESMPVSPNVLIWRTVLGACCRTNGGKTDLGRWAAENLLALEPQNAVNYVLLSNMYASGGKWEDVAEARAAMREAAVKKEAGCSWVTIKDGVHVFVAGDKSHPDSEEIYAKLQELNSKMRNAGYVPQTKYALYDLEVENKEELLICHS